MYVPGNDERKVGKIPSLGADCVVLDCEDGVAFTKKDEARNNIRKLLDTGGHSFFGKSECTVRVNSVQSGLCLQDLEVILPTTHLPSAIHLPKVDSVEQLQWFLDNSSHILEKTGRRKEEDKINLIIFIESAQAMIGLPSICKAAWDLSADSHFIPDALVFGSDDYCADIGATRTKGGGEILYARQRLVMVAKAYKLQAIDAVYIDYKDAEGLQRQCLEGAQFGFTGKQVIHPSQVSICQSSFSPSKDKVEWASALLREFDLHQKTGKGAFNFRGSMIDMPLVLQARNILQLSSSLTSSDL